MIRHTIRKILREEEETSYWNNDEQWSNDEAMYGPDKGWIPDEQWKKDQNWPQKGDEGGGSDMAESDFDWVENIAPKISFKLLQDKSIILGTGSDITLAHDGTNSKLTSTTGNFTIDNTATE